MFDTKIDAQIYTEKVMKINDFLLRELSYILTLSQDCVYEKTYFSKKAIVRKPHESCSRIRVGGGSPKKKEIENIRKLLEKHSKIGVEQIRKIYNKNLQKLIKKGSKK